MQLWLHLLQCAWPDPGVMVLRSGPAVVNPLFPKFRQKLLTQFFGTRFFTR